MKFDIIGDIHGYANKLEQLLKKLGYYNDNGFYKYPDQERKAVFLGDFIDRGPEIIKTLSIVKSMVDNETAYAIMGNHEYNALCYHTPKIGTSESWLRKRSKKNVDQHKETIHQFEESNEELKDYLPWFRTLPLFKDFGDFRVVHAAWIPSEIEKIREWTGEELKFDDSLLQKSAEKVKDEFKTIETVLKGVEINLPKDANRYKDKEGYERDEIRVKWWESMKGKTYEDMLFPPDKSQNFGKQSIRLNNNSGLPFYNDEVPVFFGHYWINPTILKPPQVQNYQICCLDYSVADKGFLVAYRWDGEKNLSNDKFMWVK